MHLRCLTAIALALIVPSAAATAGARPDPSQAAAAPEEIAGCPMFPADNIWNWPVDELPVDPRSQTWVQTIGAATRVHPDFGSGLWQGGPIGIPYVVVPGDQPRVPLTFRYANESDPGPYPIPPDAPIEGGPDSRGDRHILVVDKDRCLLYETWSTYPNPDGSWRAGSGARFDLRSNALRPDTWTSGDAAGLAILPGLVRYDEVAAGEIHHALRFTVPETQRAYVWPARHFASELVEARYPPMGLRMRLRASFDDAHLSPEARVITRALKRYGMMLADNGSAWFISGVPDGRWDNDRLHELGGIRGADFEAVDVAALMAEPDSGRVRTAAAPTATPTAPPATALPTATEAPTDEPAASATPGPTLPLPSATPLDTPPSPATRLYLPYSHKAAQNR